VPQHRSPMASTRSSSTPNPMGASQRLGVVCDFDGTITATDIGTMLFERFATSDWLDLERQAEAGLIDVWTCSTAQFGLLPSAIEELSQTAVAGALLRNGVADFFSWCQGRGIPLIVASHGVDCYVHPVLDAFSLVATDVLCGQTIGGGTGLQVSYEHLVDDMFAGERDQKRLAVLRLKAKGNTAVLIGDSLWDYPAATIADVVFARDGLLAQCRKQGLDCAPFDDFLEIRDRPEVLLANGLARPATTSDSTR